MADRSSPRNWAGQACLSMSIERMRCDVLQIMWIGRGSHGCRDDVGKGASGRVSREIVTMG